MNTKGDLNRSVRITKHNLQAAMIALLKKKEIHTITVQELTQLADVNRTTFYLHYQDVYDLLEQMEQAALQEMKTFLTTDSLNNFSKEGYPLLNHIFSYLYENQDRFIVLFGPNGRKEAKQQSMDAIIHHLVELLRNDSRFSQSQELEIGIRFVLEGGLGVLEHLFLSEHPMKKEELISFFTRMTVLIFQAYETDLHASFRSMPGESVLP